MSASAVTARRVRRGEPTHRMPVFMGLARATGGYYAEAGDQPMSVEEAIVAARLDYEVTVGKEPVEFPVITDDGVTMLKHPKFRGVSGAYADGSAPFPLGVAGKGFTAYQNRDAFNFGQTMLDEFGANVVAAGLWGDPVGSKTYMAFKLPEGFVVEGRHGEQDKIDLYAHVVNGHDAGSGLKATIAAFQLSCTNQLPGLFARGKDSINIRHTRSIAARANEAAAVFALAHRYVEEFTPKAERLLATPMSDEEFVGFMDSLWAAPKPDASARTTNGYERRRNELQELWHRGTNEVGRRTRYGALNAVTEWADWVSPIRGSVADPEVRYNRLADGSVDSIKRQALAELLPA